MVQQSFTGNYEARKSRDSFDVSPLVCMTGNVGLNKILVYSTQGWVPLF
jgi:hypothetical protein